MASLGDVDVVLFVVEAGRFGLDDAKVLALLPPGKPALLVANKLDAVHRRADMLPWLQEMQERHPFSRVRAHVGRAGRRVSAVRHPRPPAEQPWLYDEDALTDRSDRFLASEIVRESCSA